MSQFKIWNTFLTGSRAYGTPNEKSDIDFVIRMDYADVDMLKREFPAENRATTEYEDADTIVFEFGRLNLICVMTDDAFTKWIDGTIQLRKSAPVDKATSVAMLETIRHGNTGYAEWKAEQAVPYADRPEHQHKCTGKGGTCGTVFTCKCSRPDRAHAECSVCEIPF